MQGRHTRSLASAGRRCAAGDERACRLRDWQTFLDRIAGDSPWEQLRQVNVYLNRLPYREDRALWRTVDYWAAPEEFLSLGGDCEDYAIVKYLSLRALGFPADALRLAVVQDRQRQLDHAVLLVDPPGAPAGDPVVLDSMTDFILPWSEMDRYRLIYVVNEQATWVGTQARGGRS